MRRNPRLAFVAATAATLLSAPLALFMAEPARAQGEEDFSVLPSGDTDLIAVKSVAASARALSTRVQFLSEPQYDPARAEAAARAMADVLVALDTLGPWTRQAFHDAAEAQIDRIELAAGTGRRLATVQEALAWQKFAQDVAELAWDAVTVVEGLKRVDELLRAQQGEAAANAARHAPGIDLDQAWKDLNQLGSGANLLIARASSGLQEGGDGSRVLSLLIELHGRLTEGSALLQQLHEARTLGELRVRLNISALVAPIFQLARAMAIEARQELESREAELLQVLDAEERHVTEWSEHKRRFGVRHHLHAEAATEFEDAWVELWRSFQVSGAEGAPMPGEAPATWGAAFVQCVPELRRRLEVAEATLAALEVTAGAEARLDLEQRTVAPGAEVVVTYDVPAGAARRAFVSLHRGGSPHGSADENGRTKLELRSITRPAPGQRASGRVVFTAPEEAGPYDVRLSDGESDLELRYLPLEVRASAEGSLRLEFAGGAAGDVTLPPVVAGEHSEHLVELRVIDGAGEPVGGVPVDVRVLDADGSETQGGPHVRGRWGLMSDEDGGVRHEQLSPLVFAVPAGRWTIEFHSAEVSNHLRVHCSAAEPSQEGVAVVAEATPRTVNAGHEAEGRRTLTVEGSVVGGARGASYRVQARVDAAVGRIVTSAQEEQGWVDITTGGRLRGFSFALIVDPACRRGRNGVALRVLERESGRVVGEAAVDFTVLNIPPGFGLVNVLALDPYDNRVWKPWTLRWAQEGRERAWSSENAFGDPHLVPVGTWRVEYGCYFAPGKYTRSRPVQVLEGALTTVELRDHTGIIEFRPFDGSGRYGGDCQVDLFRPGEEDPSDRHIRRFASRNQTNTPTGHVPEYTSYAEVPPGTYEVRFMFERARGEYQRTEWYRVTVGPRQWRILSAQAR